MPNQKRNHASSVLILTLALFAPAALGQAEPSGAKAPGVPERIVYQFMGGTDGSQPFGGVIFGNDGNLYGTTLDGGSSNCGTVFQVRPRQYSSKTVVHSFACGPGDGSMPEESLVSDPYGNLYGTTISGGIFGYGTVFALRPSSSGWTEMVVHNFTSSHDGYIPSAALVLDSAGNLYGTTSLGGAGNCMGRGCGTVFELKPSVSGWTQSVLYSFDGTSGDDPRSLIFDGLGNLYGVTTAGGSYGRGTIFELSPSPNGWVETVLYNFRSADGTSPRGGLVFDSAGILYGTTSGKFFEKCSANNCGTVFKLEPAGGTWTLKTLHTFAGSDGNSPVGKLILDAAGNLYGTTFYGGAHNSGTVFKLAASPTGWTETLLHSFPYGALSDGMNPASGLVADQAGYLFGTAKSGGFGDGSVFEMVP